MWQYIIKDTEDNTIFLTTWFYKTSSDITVELGLAGIVLGKAEWTYISKGIYDNKR